MQAGNVYNFSLEAKIMLQDTLASIKKAKKKVLIGFAKNQALSGLRFIQAGGTGARDFAVFMPEQQFDPKKFKFAGKRKILSAE